MDICICPTPDSVEVQVGQREPQSPNPTFRAGAPTTGVFCTKCKRRVMCVVTKQYLVLNKIFLLTNSDMVIIFPNGLARQQ